MGILQEIYYAMPVSAVFDLSSTLFGYFIFPTTTFLKIRASVLRKTRRIDPCTPEGPAP